MRSNGKSLPLTSLESVCNGIDVTVLACPIQLAPPLPLEASNEGLVLGQPVYFLGFPFGWDSGLENINRGLPVPFVKAGVVSAMILGNASHIYVDAHGNKGFSGGSGRICTKWSVSK